MPKIDVVLKQVKEWNSPNSLRLNLQSYVHFADMEEEFLNNEKILMDLSAQIADMNNRMMLYLDDIKEVAKYHRTCTQ